MEILIPIFGIMLVMIPVAGVTVALLARTFAKIRRDSMGPVETHGLAERVSQLQEEVESLSAELKELMATQEFDRRLLGERAGAQHHD